MIGDYSREDKKIIWEIKRDWSESFSDAEVEEDDDAETMKEFQTVVKWREMKYKLCLCSLSCYSFYGCFPIEIGQLIKTKKLSQNPSRVKLKLHSRNSQSRAKLSKLWGSGSSSSQIRAAWPTLMGLLGLYVTTTFLGVASKIFPLPISPFNTRSKAL